MGATLRQIATVFFADLLLGLIHGLLMPMVYLYAGAVSYTHLGVEQEVDDLTVQLLRGLPEPGGQDRSHVLSRHHELQVHHAAHIVIQRQGKMCIRDRDDAVKMVQTQQPDFTLADIPEGEDRKSTRLNSSHVKRSRMPSSA